MIPGEYILREDSIELNAGLSRVRLRVDNHGDRPIQVGSHTHFFEVNRFLRSSQQDVTPIRRFVRVLWRRWVNGEGQRPPLGSESV